MLNGTGEGSIDTMTDLIGNEEEQIDLKDQLIATSQQETMLLTQQVQEIQEQLEKVGYGNEMPSSSIRFSRPTKSLRKKSSKKRG